MKKMIVTVSLMLVSYSAFCDVDAQPDALNQLMARVQALEFQIRNLQSQNYELRNRLFPSGIMDGIVNRARFSDHSNYSEKLIRGSISVYPIYGTDQQPILVLESNGQRVGEIEFNKILPQ